MRLKKATFTNLCQFTSWTVEFHPGTNVIVGPNGSGKSNLVKLLYAAFTNDFSRNEGVKDDNIYNLAGPNDKAGIAVEFHHGGVDAEVVRNLRPVSKSLRIAGGKPKTKDADITEGILGLMGATEQILREYVFVDQWKMFDFLERTNAKRAESLQRLFRTEAAAFAYDAVTTRLGKTPPPSALPIDAIKRRIAELETQKGQLAAELEQYAYLPESMVEAQASDHRLIHAYEESQRLQKSVAARRDSHFQIKAAMAKDREELAGAESDLQIIRAGVQQSKFIEAEKVREAWKRLRDRERLMEPLRRQAQALEREKRSLGSPPSRPTHYKDAADQEYFDRLRQQRFEVSQAQKFVADFEQSKGIVACPTCGAPTASDEFKDRLSEAKYFLSEEVPATQDAEATWSESRAYDIADHRYRETQADLERRERQLQVHIAGLGDMTPPTQNEAEASATLAERDALIATINDTEKLVGHLRGGLTQLDRRLVAEEGWLTKEQADLAKLPQVRLDQVDEARLRIQECSSKYEERSRLRGLLQSVSSSMEKEKDDLSRSAELAAIAERDQEWRKKLLRWQPILHRDHLPRIAASYHLAKLQERTNDVLTDFDAPFRVTAGDDLSLVATFFSGSKAGVVQSAGRLSGGEKVVLALAFRLAVNSEFASQIGLLCLDEPTAGLDKANLACLEKALVRLRELSHASGLQVLLVTHELSLARLFDNVISTVPV